MLLFLQVGISKKSAHGDFNPKENSETAIAWMTNIRERQGHPRPSGESQNSKQG